MRKNSDHNLAADRNLPSSKTIFDGVSRVHVKSLVEHMHSAIFSPLLSICLVAGLALPPLSAYTSVYLTLATLVVASITMLTTDTSTLKFRAFQPIWFAALLLIIPIPFSAKPLNNLAITLFLLPAFMAPSLAYLLRLEKTFANPIAIGIFCFAGAVGSLAIAAYDVLALQLPRAGGTNNPIHFASLSIIVGYMSIIGFFNTRYKWRVIFLLGPPAGLLSAFFSGSRGPILAGIIITLSIIPFFIRWFYREKVFYISIIIGTIFFTTIATLGGGYHLDRARSIFDAALSLTVEKNQVDDSTEDRLALYSAALEAFKESPIFGHGVDGYTLATTAHLSRSQADMRNPGHLHSDIADFAVIGGVFGLAAYFCLLLAPLLAHRLASTPTTRRAVFLGGGILSVGYFSLGLTNAMFGILPQTTLYGVLLGALVAIAWTDDKHDERMAEFNVADAQYEK